MSKFPVEISTGSSSESTVQMNAIFK